MDSHEIDLYFLNQIYPTNLTPAFSLAELDQEQEDILYDLFGDQLLSTNEYLKCIEMYSYPISPNEKEHIQKEYIDCPICLESISKWDSVSLGCRHSFCTSCISDHLESFHTITKCKDIPVCALCRANYIFLDIPNLENMIKLEKTLHK